VWLISPSTPNLSLSPPPPLLSLLSLPSLPPHLRGSRDEAQQLVCGGGDEAPQQLQQQVVHGAQEVRQPPQDLAPLRNLRVRRTALWWGEDEAVEGKRQKR
jgi:hypothetical protein